MDTGSTAPARPGNGTAPTTAPSAYVIIAQSVLPMIPLLRPPQTPLAAALARAPRGEKPACCSRTPLLSQSPSFWALHPQHGLRQAEPAFSMAEQGPCQPQKCLMNLIKNLPVPGERGQIMCQPIASTSAPVPHGHWQHQACCFHLPPHPPESPKPLHFLGNLALHHHTKTTFTSAHLNGDFQDYPWVPSLVATSPAHDQ